MGLPLLVFFISSCGFKLLPSVLSFQSKGFSLKYFLQVKSASNELCQFLFTWEYFNFSQFFFFQGSFGIYRIEYSTRQLTTLFQSSLFACAELPGQPEVRAQSLLRPFLSMGSALGMCLAFLIPRNTSELFKAPVDSCFPNFPFKLFSQSVICPNCQPLSQAATELNICL